MLLGAAPRSDCRARLTSSCAGLPPDVSDRGPAASATWLVAPLWLPILPTVLSVKPTGSFLPWCSGSTASSGGRRLAGPALGCNAPGVLGPWFRSGRLSSTRLSAAPRFSSTFLAALSLPPVKAALVHQRPCRPAAVRLSTSTPVVPLAIVLSSPLVVPGTPPLATILA